MTVKQLAVLDGLFEGKSRPEIMKDCNISLRTVKMHLTQITKRAGISKKYFIPSIRLVYLEAKKRGLLSPGVIQQLEMNTK